MEEIKVGEYIRTDDGQIGKVIEIKKRKELADKIYLDIRCNDEFYNMFVYDFDIKSHSKNIIDLIEVGDYVNGFKIYNMEYITYNNHVDLVFTIFKTPIDFTSLYKVIVTWQEKDIKSILTHEQYEQNCYKIGE